MEDAARQGVRDHLAHVVGHREDDGPSIREGEAPLERLPGPFVDEDVGVAVREPERQGGVARVGDTDRRVRNPRGQGASCRPSSGDAPERGMSEREDQLSRHLKASSIGVFLGSNPVKATPGT